MFARFLKFLRRKPPSPTQVDYSRFSPENIQRLIDEGEARRPPGPKAPPPAISKEEVEELVKMGEEIAADPEFERRLRDEIAKDKKA